MLDATDAGPAPEGLLGPIRRCIGGNHRSLAGPAQSPLSPFVPTRVAIRHDRLSWKGTGRFDGGGLRGACFTCRRAPATGAAFNVSLCGCSSVVEHLLAKERVESSNLFIRFYSHSPTFDNFLSNDCFRLRTIRVYRQD